jgi:hypothetical protein
MQATTETDPVLRWASRRAAINRANSEHSTGPRTRRHFRAAESHPLLEAALFARDCSPAREQGDAPSPQPLAPSSKSPAPSP